MINGERLVVLGWPSAILMQIAHPLVAAGVAEHSSFRDGPRAAASRLHHTIGAMRRLSFGDERARAETLARIRAIHQRVNGRLHQRVGVFPEGTPYSAEDPALVLWVHATLLDTLPRAFDALVRPLSTHERDAFCDEAAQSAIDLGAHSADVPRTWAELQRYLSATIESGILAVGEQGQEVGRAVLVPMASVLVRPATAFNQAIAVGLLPPAISRVYDLSWSERDQRRFNRAVRVVRNLRGWAPPAVALWPDARGSVHMPPGTPAQPVVR